MKIRYTLLALCGTSLISACSTTNLFDNTPRYPHLVTTMDKEQANIPVKFSASCLQEKLKANYPAASLTYIMQNYYDGMIPGLEADKPKAVYDIFGSTDDINGKITLQQETPIDPALTELFRSCLKN